MAAHESRNIQPESSTARRPCSREHEEGGDEEMDTDQNALQNPAALPNGISPGQQGSKDAEGNVLAFTLSDSQRLSRFLILGTEGGTFYSMESALTEQNTACVTNLINTGQGPVVVEEVVKVVETGRAIRMNASLLTLAMCCRCTDQRTKYAAYRAIPAVCSIPTHLFKLIHFLESHGKTSGWGRGLRKAVSTWYNQFIHNPQRLAMLVTKYQQREGWSHRDLLRLSHLRPADNAVGFILCYLVKGLDEAKKFYLEDGLADDPGMHMQQVVRYLNAVEEARNTSLPKSQEAKEEEARVVSRLVDLIAQFELLREHLPTEMLNRVEIWQSLLERMPLMALIRNLPKMTTIGLLQSEENVVKIVAKISNEKAVKASKVHPYLILMAWHTYRSGRGVKGRLRWTPVPEISKALETAFYAAFKNVVPTNKRILLALDVSGSMTFIPHHPNALTPRLSSAAMSMVTLAVEPRVDVVGFSSDLKPLAISKDWTLDQVVDYLGTIPMGSTDCCQPMLWATQENKDYEVFIIYTDNETWFSQMRPVEALQRYREARGIPNARLAVVGMTSSGFTLADPGDLYMLDIVGFDSETPTVLQEFMSGSLYE